MNGCAPQEAAEEQEEEAVDADLVCSGMAAEADGADHHLLR